MEKNKLYAQLAVSCFRFEKIKATDGFYKHPSGLVLNLKGEEPVLMKQSNSDVFVIADYYIIIRIPDNKWKFDYKKGSSHFSFEIKNSNLKFDNSKN